MDLAGGVSITYQTKEKNPSAEDMADTVYKMQRRVEQYSTEAQAYKEGNNRITVEIPGATDADKILSDLGKPGSLCFITQSDTDDNENFSIGEERYVLARSLKTADLYRLSWKAPMLPMPKALHTRTVRMVPSMQ